MCGWKNISAAETTKKNEEKRNAKRNGSVSIRVYLWLNFRFSFQAFILCLLRFFAVIRSLLSGPFTFRLLASNS